MKIKNIILDVLFPRTCVNCGKQGNYICNKCDLFLSESLLICSICGNSSPSGETHLNCLNKYSLNGLISIWDYEGLIKKLIYQVKYDGTTDIINEFMQKILFLMLKDKNRFFAFLSFLNQENVCITYVPMYIKRAKRRGFNQSAIIAQELGKYFNCPRIKLLNKITDTKKQTGLDKEERLQNVKESFGEARPLPKGRTSVLLVDDIFTTGATMKECCKILKQSGIKNIWGFTLAKTL